MLVRLGNTGDTANATLRLYTLRTSPQLHDTPLPWHHVTRNDVTAPKSLAGVTKTKIQAGKSAGKTAHH